MAKDAPRVIHTYSKKGNCLVSLHGTVDVVDEREGTVEAHKPEHDEERIGHHGHVAEEEGQLQHAVHVGAVREVVERVHEHEQPRGASVGHGELEEHH